MRHKQLIFFVALANALVGCSDETATNQSAASNTLQRLDQYCIQPGLDKPLRQTFILIDQKTLLGIQSPQEFAAKNARVRDTILAFADPTQAVEQGKSAARERITLMIAPADGSAPRKLFTGCLPALTSAEREKGAQSASQLSTFFTGGFEQDLTEAANSFRAHVVGSLINTAKSNASEKVTGSRVIQSLRAAGSLFSDVETVPRIVVVSDNLVDEIPADLAEARQAGMRFGAGQKTQLGNAELIVMGKGGESESARGYASAAFLAMGANLSSWAQSAAALTTTPVPVRLLRYTGEVYVPDTSYRELINVRIALDQNNRLVNSWAILLSDGTAGVPMTGGGVCTAEGVCDLRSDDGSFAQVWIPTKGAKLSFDDTKPFGGMRSWKLTLKGESLIGKVYDAAVARVLKEGQDSFKIEAALIQNANF